MAKRKNSERNPKGFHWSRVRAMHKRWDDPIQRERMLQHIKEMTAKRIAAGVTRAGVPDGMRKPQAKVMNAKARAEAERIVEKMADKGMFDDVDPQDRERAEEAMTEVITIMKGEGDKKTKLAAAKTILEFTKSKPVAKHAHSVNAAEAWLLEVSEDNGEDTDAPAEDAGDPEEAT